MYNELQLKWSSFFGFLKFAINKFLITYSVRVRWDTCLFMIWQWYLPYITLIYLEIIWHKISFYTLIWCFTGLTPLAHAVKSKEMEAVKQIIKMGGNINTQDCHGRTPLALATYQVSVHSNKTPITCIYYIYIYW